jgi:large subunit ribosomal protein L9
MRIILLERVEKLGAFGDVVTVKRGYGRNFLIPNRKAMRATKQNLVYFERRRAEVEAENNKRRAEAQGLAPSIDGRVVTLIRQAAEDGRLYGSVTAKAIANAIAESANINVSGSQIRINQKFKYLGVYNLVMDLHSEVAVNIKLVIAMGDENAKTLLHKSENVESPAEQEPTYEESVI